MTHNAREKQCPPHRRNYRVFEQYATARLQNGGALLEWTNCSTNGEISTQILNSSVKMPLQSEHPCEILSGGETGQPVEDAIREIRAKYNLASES